MQASVPSLPWSPGIFQHKLGTGRAGITVSLTVVENFLIASFALSTGEKCDWKLSY